MKKTPEPILLKNYTPFGYHVESINLTFSLYEDRTIVQAITQFSRIPREKEGDASLELSGEELELLTIKIDGRELGNDKYTVDKKRLVIKDVPSEFSLEVTTQIYPDTNSSLEGLYRSSGNYCTQCEAEGFRKITYYPDRPDVLSIFTTRIEADRDTYPVLLSNGNPIEAGDLPDDRHYVTWKDPFPKPCYLFALVAGNLVAIEDEFVTASGKIVKLMIYVEKRNELKCGHAMRSLKKAMRWDEEIYGLEYDLDIFMIVAVDDFNMGAMENKGLNIFNSKYVLTSPESATDQDYLGVEGVIAHEYFHNWTGNRVTCRDWFQLSLKEGLTVFRDQEFSADMNSRPVQRIDDVRLLKSFQFKEDASPMAHPVRPDSYVEINNFYTATVYNKGAEVIRMMETLIGKENFRKGMDLYFKRHDGQAVTCDDFVAAMDDASGVSLETFKNWYSQAGTPVLTVQGVWNEKDKQYKIKIKQECPPTPGQPIKKPFHMPIRIGLVGKDGGSIVKTESENNSITLELTEEEQLFVIPEVHQEPILSILRDFSAPVRINKFHSRSELAILASHDENLFNRWGSATDLAGEVILAVAEQLKEGTESSVDMTLLKVIENSLSGQVEDKALLALTLQLPSEQILSQEMETIYPDELFQAKKMTEQTIASLNKDVFYALYQEHNQPGEYYSLDPESMAQRSLKNRCLSYLMALNPLPKDVLDLCLKQYYSATNMTDTIGALSNLVNISEDVRSEVLEDFYKKWSGDPLVLDKWFALQAISWLPDTLERVKNLMKNNAFSVSNPNKVRSLIGSFCSGNHYRFHSEDGSGYKFLSERIIEIDELNPQIAARLVTPLTNWKKYEPVRANLMHKELNDIMNKQKLSNDVYEIVSKSLEEQ